MCDPLFFPEPTNDVRDSYIVCIDVRPHQRTEEGREQAAVTHLARARCQYYRNGIPGVFFVILY